MSLTLLQAGLLLALAGLRACADRQRRPSARRSARSRSREVATFDTPWAMDFLPGSGVPLTNMALLTEKEGKLWLVDVATGKRAGGRGVPAVHVAGQGGLGDVVVASRLRRQPARLSELRRGRAERHQRRGARLWHADPRQRPRRALEGFKVIWRQQPKVERRRPFLAPHRLRARRHVSI